MRSLAIWADTKTRVVNVRRERPDVYIGRASSAHKLVQATGAAPAGLCGPAPFGTFGNPCAFNRRCPVCGRVHGYSDGAELMSCYRLHLWGRLRHDKVFRSQVWRLRGLTLGCWCKPGPCHGDVIVAYLDWFTVAPDLTGLVRRLRKIA